MTFNEDSRVKIPSILHLTRLGYTYLSLKNTCWDEATNIFPDIFKTSLTKINPATEIDEFDKLLKELFLLLDYDDLGHGFYNRLLEKSGIKLIDFENFANNTFHVVTELTYKNGDEEFRPDIVLLINGMPLVFIEVKKPNNKDGVLAERKRVNQRFQNKKFKRFVNITQLMLFSNNMEYDDGTSSPIQGAFYASASYQQPIFNYFREEENLNLADLLQAENDERENFILKDNNLEIIKYNPEFITNKKPDTPTNRVSTSLFSKDRLAFLLQYGLTYVKDEHGIEKHIMRYPQLFATKAIENKLNSGIKKGIIWHTQGSGKTALAYYNVRYLTDYFQKQGVIAKFYFIVDRLDLLTQAKREFSSRGLTVHIVNSRQAFINNIKTTRAIHNLSGQPEITVINIQKFSEDAHVVKQTDYDITIQRVYFLDEVHRSYNPKGCFLANLTESDKNAIKIGLTGTPLLGEDYNSKSIFGDYIHKYYYNASIADGYTLRLIREEIASNYKIKLQQALQDTQVKQGDINKQAVYAHPRFVEPMLAYIIDDFEKSRATLEDASIGGMVVCDSSEQAKMLFEIFNDKYTNGGQALPDFASEACTPNYYNNKLKSANKVKTVALILYDIGTKEDRKNQVEAFKDGKIDLLFVYNMLLTGFDAKRLKKLYLGRVIKKHNLLQTLTRVNRTYKNFKYGYVVDFADISQEFAATNKAYFEELQAELGDELEHYSKLFKSPAEIEAEIKEINEVLFYFDTKNKEIFSQQISQIEDRQQMQALKKVLSNAKELHNIIRLSGQYELLTKIDFKQLAIFYRLASEHLDLLNLKHSLENNTDTTNLLNVALEEVLFIFTKLSEAELIIADQLKDTLRKTREALASNFDQQDPQFIALKEELERLFKKKNLSEVSQEDMKNNIGCLTSIFKKISELNRQNNQLKAKYNNDAKYTRIHKRLVERNTNAVGQALPDVASKACTPMFKRETEIFSALQSVKHSADDKVLQNNQLLKAESYFNNMMIKIVIDEFKHKHAIPLNAETSLYINQLVVKEYINEFNGITAW